MLKSYYRLLKEMYKGLRLSYGVWKIDEEVGSGKMSLDDVVNPVIHWKEDQD